MRLPFLLILIFSTACNFNNSSANTVVVENPQIDVQLNYKIEPTADGKLRIVGETNLPDETDLGVRLTAKSVKYDMLSEIKVRTGHFQSAQFSLDYKRLPPGDYIVSVAMPLSTLQPQSVRAIIGAKGENLTGKLVRRYESASVIAVRKRFKITPDGNINLIE